MPPCVVHLDALDRVRLDAAGAWRPIRRTLGLTGVGANAYTADAPGDPLIEPHDERSPGAGGHEELYVVLTGVAAFTVEGESVSAPAGTFLRVDVGVPRSALAAAPDTSVLVAGGRPGAALPVSPFEYWYAAQPAYDAGDYAAAVAIVSEGLAEHPEHGGLNYQLACYLALAGDREAAVERLRVAFASDRGRVCGLPRIRISRESTSTARSEEEVCRRVPSSCRVCGDSGPRRGAGFGV